jgi:hypothetical protein
MLKKSEKMTLTVENPALLRSVVGAFAARENRSLSAVIERTTLNALLPSDPYMRAVAQYQLFSEGGNIGAALETLFENNSAGIDWHSKHTNYLPFVFFAREKSSFCKDRLLSGDEVAIKFASSHTASQLESIIDYLRELGEKSEDEIKAAYFQREVKLGEFYLKELKEEPQFFKPINLYNLVINNWDQLSWWSITFRLLNDLVQLQTGWRDDPEAQLELLDLMKSVSAEWEQQQP